MAPEITVVVPVLDEAGTVAACLDAVAAQDIGLGAVEVIVVDGGSTDGTVAISERRLRRHAFGDGRLLASPVGTRPANLNAGLAAARGRILCRVDARSRLPRDYLRRCRELLDSRPELCVVGGRQRACSPDGGIVLSGIARALNNRWATGLSRYRRALHSGPSDTVYLGAFRTEQLRSVGGWRIDLPVNEDFDLNRRMARLGMVWFDADLVVDYVPRATLGALLRQYVGFGRSKVRYWRLTGERPRPRQLALLTAPVVVAGGVGAALAAVPPAARWAVLVAALGTAAGIEAAGSDSPPTSVGGHAAGILAMACIAAGWLLGVTAEWLAGARGAGGAHARDVA